MCRGALLGLFAVCLSTLAYAQGVDQSALNPNVGEQRGIDQLRAIVEAIESCRPLELPADAVDPLGEGFSDVYGPPMNVIWNVELHPSIRARYRGSIEFSEPSYFKLPPGDSYCNKPKMNKNECRRRWILGTQLSEQRANHPLRFRYEFDVTDHGLEFVQVFKKTNQADDEPWVDGGIDSEGCAYRAIKANPARPSGNQEEHLPGIPKELLDSAKHGQPDAQYLIGTMYAEGNGVPQDYTEAYFG
jgi:hypothetical protein